jgi:cytochrome c553
LRKSFDQYASDSRPQPKKMQEKFAMLSAADLDALANYYGSIQ